MGVGELDVPGPEPVQKPADTEKQSSSSAEGAELKLLGEKLAGDIFDQAVPGAVCAVEAVAFHEGRLGRDLRPEIGLKHEVFGRRGFAK